MVVNNIQDKLEGDELDLSMMSLKEVPLKEIASVTRATTLDLSSNLIRHLPPNFGILVNLIKLDISSNKLQALPKTFYLLVNLKHLDLYNNQLTDLPVSLHHLAKLRFLDIKNNPLTSELRSVVGDCITRKECEAAAKKLIAYFTKEKQLALEQEVMANKMKEQREQQHREEAEAARLRNEKKAAKKERKNENKHHKQHERQQQQLSEHQQQSSASQANAKTNGNAAKTQRMPSKGSRSSSGGSWCSCLGWVNLMLFAVITMSAGYCLHLHIEGDYSAAGLQEALPRLQRSALRLQNMTVEALQPDNLRKTGYLVLRHANTSAYQAAEATQRAAYAAQEYIEVYTGDLTPYTSKVSSWCSVACTWTKQQALLGYEWLIAQDWQGMWDAFISVCMQVWSKIQAAWASAMANPSVKAAWDYICQQCSIAAAWIQSCALIVIKYMQDNGPLWLQWLQDNVNNAVTAVRNSVQSLIK